MSEPTTADAAAPRPAHAPDRVDVLGLARYTIPVHALLPLPIAWLVEGGHDGWLQAGFGVIHLGFPIFLALTYPWWRGQGAELVALLIANHLVTLAAGVGLILGASALS